MNATGGPLFEDVVSGMFVKGICVNTINYTYGVGGRDVTEKEINRVYKELQDLKDMSNPYRYLGLKEKNA